MSNYMSKSLHIFQHPTLRRAQYVPHQWTRPNYSATKQLANPLENQPPILEEHNLRIQKMVGNFLYYTLAVECTMLPYLNSIAEQHTQQTQNNESAISHFLDYATTNPNAVVKFRANDMVIHINRDE